MTGHAMPRAKEGDETPPPPAPETPLGACSSPPATLPAATTQRHFGPMSAPQYEIFPLQEWARAAQHCIEKVPPRNK